MATFTAADAARVHPERASTGERDNSSSCGAGSSEPSDDSSGCCENSADTDLALAIALSMGHAATSSASASSANACLSRSGAGTTTQRSGLKRQRREYVGEGKSSSSDSCAPRLHLVPPGHSGIMMLPTTFTRHRQLPAVTVEHGSSLSLIARGTACLNAEFSEQDPGASWKKWSRRGAQPYFVALVENGKGGGILSVLRFLMDGDVESGHVIDNDPLGSCSRRIAIDYLCTPPQHQGQGHATRLLALVFDLAQRHRCNLFVLALEESCPYWMNKGFILEANDGINKRLNKFPDTHLLKLPSNMVDIIPETLDSNDDSEDDEDDEDEDDDEDDEDEDDDDLDDENNAVLQQALAESAAAAAASTQSQGYVIGMDATIDQDAALQIALAASLRS